MRLLHVVSYETKPPAQGGFVEDLRQARGELFFSSGQTDCCHFRSHAQFAGFECVFLCHGFFGAVETIEDELAEEGIPDFTGYNQILFGISVCQEEMPPPVHAMLIIFAEFDYPWYLK